jgi:hypothetical protein
VPPYLAADGSALRAAAVTALARTPAPAAVEEAVRLVEEEPRPYETFRAAIAVAEEFGAQALPVAGPRSQYWAGWGPPPVTPPSGRCGPACSTAGTRRSRGPPPSPTTG